ncbi:hypothetical protein AB0B25_09780 [Nocardia sp. NPDC049190]|uniref:hypothetical protein n=1 Tax=Nocardia sp. NPDC049190 TaxID=3155650 RepID=UPI00340ED95D
MPDELSNGSSEIAALAQQVETARGKLPLQLDPALLRVLSEREIAAERELAEWIRAQRRRQRRTEIVEELAAERRDRKSAAAVRRSDEADARWHRRALAARRRVSSEDARLAQLYRRAEWSSRALIAVVVLGMVWAGVNVQHNLVPSGDMTDPLYWLSYGIEAMISIPIITIMVAATTAARWGRELARGKVIFFEAALLGTTVALNTGPHVAAREFGRATEYAIAPVMVGVVIWLHAWVSARYAVLIDGAPVVDRDPQPIRVDAERAHRDGGRYPSGEDSSTDGGRFRRDGRPGAPQASGEYDADSGARIEYPDGWGIRRAGYEPVDGYSFPLGTTSSPIEGGRDESIAATATTAVAHPDRSPADGHVVDSPTTGHVSREQTNGHSVDHAAGDHHSLPMNQVEGSPRTTSAPASRPDRPSVNGHPHRVPLNGHTAENTTSGRTHNHHVDGYTVPSTTDRNAHNPVAGEHIASAADGHPVEDTINGKTHNSDVKGHAVLPSTNGNTSDTRDNKHPALSATNGRTAADGSHTGVPVPQDSTGESTAASLRISPTRPQSPVADYVFDLSSNGHTPTENSAAQQFSASTRAAGTASAGVFVVSSDTVEIREDTRTNTGEPPLESAKATAPQQISLAELHDGFEFDDRSATATAGTNPLVAQQLPTTHRASRSFDRPHRGSDGSRHPSPGGIDPVRTPPPLQAADTAAQVHPAATAPRTPKRENSLAAEQSDRSADAESERLALDETPEPPLLVAERMPLLDVDDEDDDSRAEPEEADTDDDEISAIARAITGRRLSALPIEEVREILTLADQGGSTPAIANELGVSRAAVTRVLDSAIKVHRPYAITG